MTAQILELNGAALLDADKTAHGQAPAALARTRPADAHPGLALRLQGIGKRYGQRQVLEGISLDIQPGEFVAIVGRSGCGKSTLLRLLAQLEQPSEGQIDALTPATPGKPTAAVPLAQRRDDIRIMFQDARLLPWKRVLDNVGLGLNGPQTLSRSAQALAQVGLAERAGEWPAVLSGGQRQRIALARALVHAPRLLLLDEPLGALDALTRIEMHRLIEGLWQQHGFTALLVTHDVAEAVALADRVLLIEDGRIALDQRIDLPRPRRHGSPAFARFEETILRRVLQQPATQEPEAPALPLPPGLRFAI